MTAPTLTELLENLSFGQPLTFSVVNHGCKVNRVEADTIAASIAAAGGLLCDGVDCSLVVVNTCTVTAEADKKARKAVRHALKEAPRALVVVTGCGAAIDPAGFESISERVAVIDRAKLIALTKPEQGMALRAGDDFRTRVNLKIQDGCNHACTYCIVHVARGKAVSTPFEEVVAEAGRYLELGVKELVLTGIDLASYNDGGRRLADLAERLIAVADEKHDGEGEPARVRASSLEPMTIDDRFIDVLARSGGRICRHLHLPLQSGSSKVLGEMARPYDAEQYVALVERMRSAVPELSLTTDIIVGFPGETDADFDRTLGVARACGFSKIHVFPYSRRNGTPAAARADQLNPEVIRERARVLRDLSDELRNDDLMRRAGSRELALVETRYALTESYHEVTPPPNAREGSLVPITMGVER